MAQGKRYQRERIVTLLRQIDVAVANRKTTPLACREAGVTEQSYYRSARSMGVSGWTKPGT
jgi:putative transposase